MPILAFGLNHRTAQIDLRERVAFAESDLPAALTALQGRVPDVAEAVILSTCNRTEIYCALSAAAAQAPAPATNGSAAANGHAHPPLPLVGRWLAETSGLEPERLRQVAYVHRDEQAAWHMMRVASGLDSQVLGEPQIMGQVKVAYESARETGTVGSELGFMVETSLRIAKRVRTETAIGRNPVSVAYAAVTLARRIFANLGAARALLIGAGETIDLVAQHMQRAGITAISVANRTLERASTLASRLGGDAMPLTSVADRLAEFDIVVSSTASPLPVIGKGTVERAVKRRRHSPVFMVDIAVPRDIEPEVGELSDVYLYSIDDLTEIIGENLANRESAAAEAEQMVAQGAADYARERRMRAGQAVLRQYRAEAQELRDAALAAARRRLDAGQEPDQIMERLAADLTNKLLHRPTVAIRQASAHEDGAVLAWLREHYSS